MSQSLVRAVSLLVSLVKGVDPRRFGDTLKAREPLLLMSQQREAQLHYNWLNVSHSEREALITCAALHDQSVLRQVSEYT